MTEQILFTRSLKFWPILAVLLFIMAGMVSAAPSFKRVGQVRMESDIAAQAMSPDGRMLVTMTGASAPVLWEVATGQKLAELRGREPATGAVFSPDGAWMATFHSDALVRVWRLMERGAYVQRLDRPYAEIEPSRKEKKEMDLRYVAMTFSRDARVLYIATNRGGIIAWDIERRRTGGGKSLVGDSWGSGIRGLHTPPGPGVLVVQAYSVWLNNTMLWTDRIRLLDADLRPRDLGDSSIEVQRIAFGDGNREVWILGYRRLGAQRSEALFSARLDRATTQVSAYEMKNPKLLPILPESMTPVVMADGALIGLTYSGGLRLSDVRSGAALRPQVMLPVPEGPAGVRTIYEWSPGGRMLIAVRGPVVEVYRGEKIEPEAVWLRAAATAEYAVEAFRAGFGQAAVEQFREAIAQDAPGLWNGGFVGLAVNSGMPVSLAGEIAVAVHARAKTLQPDGRWADPDAVWDSGLGHALYAVAAGQPALARGTLIYLHEIEKQARPGDHGFREHAYRSNYGAALEALILASEGKVDDAYARLLRHRDWDERFVAVLMGGSFLGHPDGGDGSARPWAPLYTDLKRLAFVTKLDEAKLREVVDTQGLNAAERAVPQSYPGLDGKFVQPPATRPPALELKR